MVEGSAGLPTRQPGLGVPKVRSLRELRSPRVARMVQLIGQPVTRLPQSSRFKRKSVAVTIATGRHHWNSHPMIQGGPNRTAQPGSWWPGLCRRKRADSIKDIIHSYRTGNPLLFGAWTWSLFRRLIPAHRMLVVKRPRWHGHYKCKRRACEANVPYQLDVLENVAHDKGQRS
jgi:hypothetical protein